MASPPGLRILIEHVEQFQHITNEDIIRTSLFVCEEQTFIHSIWKHVEGCLFIIASFCLTNYLNNICTPHLTL